MKFSEFPYLRPDIESIKLKIQPLILSLNEASSPEEQIILIKEINKTRIDFNTMYNLCAIRHSINTNDQFYIKEQNFFDNQLPMFENIQTEFYKAIITSQFKQELENYFGGQFFRIAEISLKTFSPEIIDDLIKENILCTEYTNLTANASIQFDGSEKNLSEMAPYMRDVKREIRISAAEAKWNFFQTHEEIFNRIFDELVKVRHTIALKLGYENFIPLAYDRLCRTDYHIDNIAAFRESIKKYIIPVVNTLKAEQTKRLQIDSMKYYDEALLFKNGNAKPKGTAESIIENGKKMYSELSKETSEFIAFMTKKELMDLVAKKGKAPGGFCTYLASYQSPFIFSNFNGTSADIDVLTHEVGHAFQVFTSRNIELPEYYWPTYEAAEIHSMSMEYFTYPFMHLFFHEESEKYQYAHLIESLYFLPYGAAIDEFQHEVYANPSLTAIERKNIYRSIEKKYLPHRDNAENTFLENGGFWQGQAHIYQSPFYYIDYTLAQICAFQFFLKDRQHHESAFSDYVNLCKAGGSKSFLELVEIANLKSPFNDDCMKQVTEDVFALLNSLSSVYN